MGLSGCDILRMGLGVKANGPHLKDRCKYDWSAGRTGSSPSVCTNEVGALGDELMAEELAKITANGKARSKAEIFDVMRKHRADAAKARLT